MLGFLAILSTAVAGGLQTDRPSIAASAQTVPSQLFQIESGLQMDLGLIDVLSLPTTLRYGLNDTVELRLDTSLVEFGGKVYPPSLGLGCKLNFLDSEEMDVGLLVGSTIPYQGGPPAINAAGLLDMALGPVSGWANLGIVGGPSAGQLYLLGTYSLGASMGITEDYGLYAEHTGLVGGGGFNGLIQIGGGWSTSNLALDAFYQISITIGGMHTIGAGISYRWGS
jgi:hypothetical protein